MYQCMYIHFLILNSAISLLMAIYTISNFLLSPKVLLLQEGDPLKGPKVGSCLTLGNELSEEMHVLTKQETLLGRGAQVESRRVREPRRTALPHGSQSQALW